MRSRSKLYVKYNNNEITDGFLCVNMAGKMDDWLVGWLAGCLPGWLNGCMND